MTTGAKVMIGLVGAVLGGGLVLGVGLMWLMYSEAPKEVPVVETGVMAEPPEVVVSPPPSEPVEAATPAADPFGPGGGEVADASAGTVPAEASFEDLMGKVFAGEADSDEQLKFWELMRTTDKVDGVIADLKAQVEADGEDEPGRMTLAQLYVMKLLSAPAGPERGLWSAKAEALWSEVLEQNPDHFEAQHSIAFSLSQYPDFLNKTGEAIAAYEKAIAIEERTGASEQTARAYVELARLHQKSGDPASALEVLERGVGAHPDHGQLTSQLDKLKQGFVFEGKDGE